MVALNGKGWMSTVIQGAELAVGASIALGLIRIIADATGGIIPRQFVLSNVGETMNTLNWTGRPGEYDLS